MQKASSVDDLLKGKSSKPSEAGVGSGVIYQINNNSAYIVTNNHVIDGANEIRVQLHNKKQVKAKLVGKDASTILLYLKLKIQKVLKRFNSPTLQKYKLAIAYSQWVTH